VDLLAIGRALQENLRQGEIVSGASTLTMQVIRLSRRNPPRTIGEKILEMLLALRLELTHSKEEILQHYAAHAPFGGNVVGLEAACWRFFGRPPEQLTWAEAALLAVLPNSPGLFHISRGREALRTKRNALLGRLQREGHMDQFTLDLALLEPLPEQPQPLPLQAPHLLFSPQISGSGNSGRLETTLDGALQRQVLEVAQRHYLRNSQNDVENLGILVVHVPTQTVAAYVGNSWFGRDLLGDNGHVDVVQAPRSTGSLLKPFLYMSMLSDGSLLPTHLLADVPTRMGTFVPENHTRTYLGAVRAREALARSLNVPFARLLRDFGLGKFYYRLKDWGMRSLFRPVDQYGITLILGGAEGSLWDLTSIYSSLAAQLTAATEGPRFDRGSGGSGEQNFFRPSLLRGAPAESWSASTVDPGALYLTFEDLLEVYRPDEEGAWREFLSSRKVAWKTGTSFGYRDAWSIGVTPEYVVGVWVGNADGQGRPDLTGSKVAAPLLFDTLSVLPDTSWFSSLHLHLVSVDVDRQSGYLPGPYSQETQRILVPTRGAQSPVSPYHQRIFLDEKQQFRVDSSFYPVSDMVTQDRFVLPPSMEYYYLKNHLDYQALPPWHPQAQQRSDRVPFHLEFPPPGALINIPINRDGSPGKILFEAYHSNVQEKLYWYLDGQYLETTQEFHYIPTRPAPGEHRLLVEDERGNRILRSFTVLGQNRR
jgi:penicillin-binding protein 1C